MNRNPTFKLKPGQKIARRPVSMGNAIGEVLGGLLKEKGWTFRDLEQKTIEDDLPGRVTHQYISVLVRGVRVPSEQVLNRLLKPFGYRASQELRVEPITEEENKA